MIKHRNPSNDTSSCAQKDAVFILSDNNNPFHDYAEINCVCHTINTVNDDIFNPEKETCAVFRHNVKFNPYYFLKKHGMNICLDKQHMFLSLD